MKRLNIFSFVETKRINQIVLEYSPIRSVISQLHEFTQCRMSLINGVKEMQQDVKKYLGNWGKLGKGTSKRNGKP